MAESAPNTGTGSNEDDQFEKNVHAVLDKTAEVSKQAYDKASVKWTEFNEAHKEEIEAGKQKASEALQTAAVKGAVAYEVTKQKAAEYGEKAGQKWTHFNEEHKEEIEAGKQKAADVMSKAFDVGVRAFQVGSQKAVELGTKAGEKWSEFSETHKEEIDAGKQKAVEIGSKALDGAKKVGGAIYSWLTSGSKADGGSGTGTGK